MKLITKPSLPSFQGTILLTLCLLFSIQQLHAQSADNSFKKNEVSASLNTLLFLSLGTPKSDGDRDLAFFYTRRINTHWAWRAGAGYRKTEWGFYGPYWQGAQIALHHRREDQDWAKAGMLRYTRGKIFSIYYGLDLGYLIHKGNTASDLMCYDSIGYERHTVGWRYEEYNYRGLVVSPVFGLRAELNRHLALTAECSPEFYMAKGKGRNYSTDASGNIQWDLNNKLSYFDTNTVPILTRFNLVFKF